MGQTESKNTSCYHILMVQEGSPAEEAGLQPFFDYITAINGIRLDKDDSTLANELQNNIHKECILQVYTSKGHEFRDVKIVPSENWGGVGYLGARIRFCSYEGANENIWHILKVYPNSPAERAGLQNETDYVIASPEALLHDQNAFSELIEQSIDNSVRLYVYNSQTDNCREVTLTPTRNWGGNGSIGCDIGYGYIHRIPKPQNRSNVNPQRQNERQQVATATTTTTTVEARSRTEEIPDQDAPINEQTAPVSQIVQTEEGFTEASLVVPLGKEIVSPIKSN